QLERRIEETESGLWRTPQASEAIRGPKSRELYEKCLVTGQSMVTLTDQAKHAPGLLWPTPTAQDGKNATLPPSQKERDSVPGALIREGQKGSLNPAWVECLMGFPPGWTDIDGQQD
ncbi:hypothetical protein, partial [Thermoactinomyces daqus]|uniref:hypothetical protein n=1 Tax=Thermoactinomyces daqus TaxID=1329516 RepID=UPI001C688197